MQHIRILEQQNHTFLVAPKFDDPIRVSRSLTLSFSNPSGSSLYFWSVVVIDPCTSNRFHRHDWGGFKSISKQFFYLFHFLSILYHSLIDYVYIYIFACEQWIYVFSLNVLHLHASHLCIGWGKWWFEEWVGFGSGCWRIDTGRWCSQVQNSQIMIVEQIL